MDDDMFDDPKFGTRLAMVVYLIYATMLGFLANVDELPRPMVLMLLFFCAVSLFGFAAMVYFEIERLMKERQLEPC